MSICYEVDDVYLVENYLYKLTGFVISKVRSSLQYLMDKQNFNSLDCGVIKNINLHKHLIMIIYETILFVTYNLLIYEIILFVLSGINIFTFKVLNSFNVLTLNDENFH